MWIGKNRLHVNWRYFKSDQKIVSSIKLFMLHRGDVINKQNKTKPKKYSIVMEISGVKSVSNF